MKAKSKIPVKLIKIDTKMNSIYIERLERLFDMIEKSNEWKKKYEYFQLAKDVNEDSIIVSET
jgi:hypothetical protein